MWILKISVWEIQKINIKSNNDVDVDDARVIVFELHYINTIYVHVVKSTPPNRFSVSSKCNKVHGTHTKRRSKPGPTESLNAVGALYCTYVTV